MGPEGRLTRRRLWSSRAVPSRPARADRNQPAGGPRRRSWRRGRLADDLLHPLLGLALEIPEIDIFVAHGKSFSRPPAHPSFTRLAFDKRPVPGVSPAAAAGAAPRRTSPATTGYASEVGHRSPGWHRSVPFECGHKFHCNFDGLEAALHVRCIGYAQPWLPFELQAPYIAVQHSPISWRRRERAKQVKGNVDERINDCLGTTAPSRAARLSARNVGVRLTDSRDTFQRHARAPAATDRLRVMAAPARTLPKRWSAPEVSPEQRRLARCGAPGSRDRDYWVYGPRRSRTRRLLGRPAVVMVLHGCDQSAEALIRSTRFVEQAAARGYVVVFPHVTSWSPLPLRARNCWGFWIEAERHRDEGEVGDLRRILDQVEREFGADPRRRYVAGLSSGGAMAVAMAVAYPDVVRAAGAVAGLAYGESSAAVSIQRPFRTLAPWFSAVAAGRQGPQMRSLPSLVHDMEAEGSTSGDGRPLPLLIIQSTQDQVVQLENARMLRDVWLSRHGGVGDVSLRREELADAAGVRCSYFDMKGRILVETVFYEGRSDTPTHYWPGDSDDPPYADLTGPSATDALLDFFEREGL